MKDTEGTAVIRDIILPINTPINIRINTRIRLRIRLRIHIRRRTTTTTRVNFKKGHGIQLQRNFSKRHLAYRGKGFGLAKPLSLTGLFQTECHIEKLFSKKRFGYRPG
jgi:hypothetical protein